MVPAIVIFCTRTEASMLITAGQAVKKFKEDFPMKRIVSILAVLVLLLYMLFRPYKKQKQIMQTA